MRHENNFDLIRLAAASQVLLFHAVAHLGMGVGPFAFLGAFPGVPVFFVIPGFLVTSSYERSGSLTRYTWNRGLRIYPALWVCFLVTLVVLGAYGFLTADFLAGRDGRSLGWWVFDQVTFFQFLGSHHFDRFGVGVVNGSLWTISVELGFYALLPLLWALRGRLGSIAVPLVAAASYALWLVVMPHAEAGGWYSRLNVSPLPYLWLFVLGAFAHRHWSRVRPLLAGKLPLWLAIHAPLWLLLPNPQNDAHGWFTPFQYLSLAAVTLSGAFTLPHLARLLRGYDLSYGVYLYHMVVMNAVIQARLGGWMASALAWAGTFALAWLSWRFVERKALEFKKQRPLAPQPLSVSVPDALTYSVMLAPPSSRT